MQDTAWGRVTLRAMFGIGLLAFAHLDSAAQPKTLTVAAFPAVDEIVRAAIPA